MCTEAKLEHAEDVLRTYSLPADEDMETTDGGAVHDDKRARRAVRQKAAQQRYRCAALSVSTCSCWKSFPWNIWRGYKG